MSLSHGHAARRRRMQPALTLVEMVISMILVSVMLVAALDVLGAAKLSQQRLSNRLIGEQLAHDLMAEILQHDYADPAAGEDSFGLDAEDVGTGDRSLFDDVDDYDGWDANPPRTSDGATIPEAAAFKRRVNVRWADPADPAGNSGSNQQLKRIEVQVQLDGQTVSSIHALKAVDPPDTEACCFNDGTSVNLGADVCLALGGTPQGPATSVLTNSCPPPVDGPDVLLVVRDAASPISMDLARKALMESWGFNVTLIAAAQSQAAFDTALETNDAAYVSELGTTAMGELGSKLDATTKGVLTEEARKVFGMGGFGLLPWVDTDTVRTVDDKHYITSPFPKGDLVISSSVQSLWKLEPTLAPGLKVLAQDGSDRPLLAVVERGDQLNDGSPALGRRVAMPWGMFDYDITQLNADGLTIMQRAIEWAADPAGGAAGGIAYETFAENGDWRKFSSLEVPTPAGTSEGDLLIAAVVTDLNQAASLSAPAGWNLIAVEQRYDTVTLGVWWKLAGASEPADHQFTWGSKAQSYGWMMRFTGHDPADPIDAWSLETAGSGAALDKPSPAVVSTVDNAMILRIGGFDGGDITVGDPGLPGHTAITMNYSDDNGSSVACSGGAGYVLQEAAGDSGASTFTLTEGEQSIAVTISIAPLE